MTESSPDPAKARFIAMQLIRLSGAFFVVLGLLVVAHRIAMPLTAGYILIGIGMFDLLVFPLLLARRWKSPPP